MCYLDDLGPAGGDTENSAGGSLRVYQNIRGNLFKNNELDAFADITPTPGLFVAFDSMRVPHEVRPLRRDVRRRTVTFWLNEVFDETDEFLGQ